MMFVRHNGNRSGEGRFTKGKTYVAGIFEEGAAVSLGSMTLTDDSGREVREGTESGRLDFMQFVYAVVVKPSNGLRLGDVVRLDETSPDGKMFRLGGVGCYYATDMFEILDWTNVVPGMRVMMLSSSEWVTVERINESIWLFLEGGEKYVSPESVRFAVIDGGVAMGAFVRTGDKVNIKGLRGNAFYPIVREDREEAKVLLKMENGNEMWFDSKRFEPM